MALPLILPLALAPIAAVVSAPEPATVEPDNSDASAEVAAMAGESARKTPHHRDGHGAIRHPRRQEF
jgi:phospholipid-binding lipoprotein MlaA